MAFHITVQPFDRTPGLSPTTVVKETAIEALVEVESLEANGESVEVRDDAGRIIEKDKLRDLAGKVRN